MKLRLSIIGFLLITIVCGCQSRPEAMETARQKLSDRSFCFKAVSGVDENHVWAVGDKGNVFFSNGKSWEKQDVPSLNYRNIFALDTNHIWVVSDKGAILFFDGSSWVRQREENGEILNGIFALDNKHAWAVGTGGTVLFYDGKSWQQQYVDGYSNFTSVAATGPKDVYVVGDRITLSYNGSWSKKDIDCFLYDVSTDGKNIYAVGDCFDKKSHHHDSFVFIINDGNWKLFHEIPDLSLPQISVSNNAIYLSGGCEVFKYNGSKWIESRVSLYAQLRDIDALEDRVWAVGQKSGPLAVDLPAIYSFDGTIWNEEEF